MANTEYSVIRHYRISDASDLSLHSFPWPGPKVIKRFSCFTQLSMKLVFPINLILITIAKSFLLNIAEHEHFSANKYENAKHFHIY